MNPRSALLVALLAAGFVSQSPVTGPASSARKNQQTIPPPSQGTVSFGEKLEVENWPQETLHEFFTTRLNATQEAKSPCPTPGDTPLHFLIATIPDPENSHYPYMFDRFEESIIRAAQDENYVLDRHWLPWEAEAGPADSDWLKREQHQDWRTRKQDYPGILVFRSTTQDLQVLAVLLVGENSVSGINKQQFENALGVIAHFKGKLSEPLKVLGPSFSGTACSMGMVMREVRATYPDVGGYQVITGSATSPVVWANMETCAKVSHKSFIHFATAIDNDDVVLERFLGYVKDHLKVQLNRVAILSELGTAYGGSVRSHFSAEAGEESPRPSVDLPLSLSYPMEISRLRNAYEDDSELSALSGSAAGTPRRGLQITLKDSHGSDDSLPSFSTALSPVSQEAALLDTLAIISRNRIEFAGLFASDILDAIFLGRMLKAHCPDVRLFMLDADMVYADVAQQHAFQGMMLVTNYPLFAANQSWTGTWSRMRPMHVFPTATAEGVYNASRMLLGGGPGVQKRQVPLAEFASPVWDGQVTPKRPAVWLTVVGRDGLWPLTTLRGDEQNGKKARTAGVRVGATRAARVWLLCLCLVAVLGGLFAMAVFRANGRRGDGIKIRQDLVAMVQVTGEPEARWFATAACALLLSACGLLAVVQMSYLTANAPINLNKGLIVQLACCIVIPALLVAAGYWCWRPKRDRWLAVAVAGCVAVPVLTGYAVHFWHPLSVPLLHRMVYLGNGVSPIVPVLLLLAALFWYTGMNLNRIRMRRVMPIRCGAKDGGRSHDLPVFEGDVYLGGDADGDARHWPSGSLQEVYHKLIPALDSWRFREGFMIALPVLALSILGWALVPWHIGSLEGFRFDRFYAAGLFVLYAALLFACARFLRVWFGLRTILIMLEQHPIRKAFRRLGKQESELSPAGVWRWGGGKKMDLTLAPSIERLRTLAENHDLAYGAELAELEQKARPVIAARSAGLPVTMREIEAVNHCLLGISEGLIRSVLWQRSREPVGATAAAMSAGASVSYSAGRGAAAGETTPALSATENAAAEDFVALRFAALIRYVTLHLKNLLEFVAGGLILGILSLFSYPFEPHHLMMTVISTCFAGMGSVFLFVFLQMNRNTIISYLSGTKPGKLDGNLLHLISFGALPLLTVVAAQFPSVGGFLFSWVKPALETMR